MSPTQYSKEMSLGKWEEMFKDVYFSTQNYRRPATEIFTQLAKVFGGGSHYLFRTHDPKGSREFLAKIFAWYCALAVRLSIDLEDAIWQKYPGVCPRCQDSTCGCGEPPAEIDTNKLSMIALERKHHRPGSLREWQNMFSSIYRGPSGKEQVPPTRERVALVFSRIAEELGEVAEAILLDPAIDQDVEFVLKNEMADLGAWIFALANNLHFVDPASSGVALADVVWDLYPGRCHRCHETRCVCVRGTYRLELAEKGAMGPSHWDERTGLANDKALARYIQYADQQYSSGQLSWSFIFLDLDNFGQVNKTHGHAVGDEVLRTAAQRIAAAVGKHGIPFRRGGEEFLIVLHTSHNHSIYIAECIRRELSDVPVSVILAKEKLSLAISASLGVASCQIDGGRPSGLEAVAEARSREAKTQGKNRVVPEVSEGLLREFVGRAY